ncbi:MAG TPA: hypothetical protein PLQ56_16770 [Aggregatilineales bacterium]|nr:hypothetical protein [Aggregatilineales bacterium]
MSEQLEFKTVEQLEQLSTAELNALWELVPTERQRAYKAAYEREVRAAGAVGSDALERQVAGELLKRYRENALVPLGMRWARTPGRVQEAARTDALLDAPEDGARPAGGKPSRKVMLIVGVIAVLFVGLLLTRLGGRGSTEVAAAPTASPTPDSRLTPTPLALEDQDEIIEGGDRGREVAYPVSLHIVSGDAAPRVWVVQRRRVSASEWNYDPNPDTASFVNGMSVRPVLGIPWSEENAALFEALGAGAQFTLTMNTGAVLHYEFGDLRQVRRSETSSFRQISPGLALVLIGETDSDGLPTATRTLVMATYSPDQELERTSPQTPLQIASLGEGLSELLLSTPMPTTTPIPFAGLDVQLIAVTMLDGQVTTRLRLYNGGWETLRFSSDDLWIAFGYAENPPGPRIPAENMPPFDLLPGQAADITLVWPWSGEPYASLEVGGWRFAMQF